MESAKCNKMWYNSVTNDSKLQTGTVQKVQ